MKSVLFLCSGNYYRSRFAEIFFNFHAAQWKLPWFAVSRGLAINSQNNGNLSRFTVSRLLSLGIPVENCQRYPMKVSLLDLKAAHHIVAVKGTEHAPLIAIRFPEWLDKIEFWEVHDVDCASPQEALPLLEREVFGLLGRLSKQKKRSA